MKKEPQGEGDCYEVHANLMIELKNDEYTLCHGNAIGQGPISGIEHGHCWIEYRDLVLDISNGKAVTYLKSDYYLKGHINPEKVKRYTWKEMAHHMIETEHYGPWDDDE